VSRPFQIVLVVVLLTAAGVLGFGAYRFFAGRQPAPTAAPAPGATAATDTETEAEPTPLPAPGLPETRPVFALKDREGVLRSITDWDGKSLVINFWATWCAPCRREIPMLKTLHAERASQNIEVIGVAVDFREDVLAYAKNMAVDYPLLIGEQDGLDAVGLFGLGSTVGFPFTVFTDDRGRIVTAHLGELQAGEANAILDAVVGVNRGSLTLERAKAQIASALERIEPEPQAPAVRAP
jgi:thiol-disulfide isomerase/thioredoxin